jgi:hypothetical protein
VGIALDAASTAYVVGVTESSNFETSSKEIDHAGKVPGSAFQAGPRGGGDTFVAKFADDPDNDLVPDQWDNCVGKYNLDPQLDTDGDGVGDACDLCPSMFDPDQTDIDRDFLGSPCDPDDDGDGDLDGLDNCPFQPNADQADSDMDAVGNFCDNCPTAANSDQEDFDGDLKGDACDPDDDGDDISDDVDLCLMHLDSVLWNTNVDPPTPEQGDSDLDKMGAFCDNCPAVANADQTNTDCKETTEGTCSAGCDLQGDACDLDDDGDGVEDGLDNCPFVENADQGNTDNAMDGGNVCDTDDDNDGRADGMDSSPLNRLVCADTDADTCDDCSLGTFNPANDGLDTDADGQCNLKDSDDDNDGIPDVDETAKGSDPFNRLSTPEVCDGRDNDLNEGVDEGFPDTDGDGIKDCVDSTPKGVFTIAGVTYTVTIRGTASSETLTGTSGNDVIAGLGGNDSIYGGGGTDVIGGGSGADSTYGQDGNDILLGEAGNDTLYGGAGNDKMYGGADTDTCDGGSGSGDSTPTGHGSTRYSTCPNPPLFAPGRMG